MVDLASLAKKASARNSSGEAPLLRKIPKAKPQYRKKTSLEPTRKASRYARKATRPSTRARVEEEPGEIPDAPTGYVSELSHKDWIEFFIPWMFPDGLYPIQIAMLEFIQDKPYAVFEVFRGAGKSWLGQALLARFLCDNPNLVIGIFRETITKAKQSFRVIKKIIFSEKVKEFYGDLKGEVNTQTELILKRTREVAGPSLQALSWGSSAQGAHFNIVLWDDIWSGMDDLSEAKKHHFIEWFWEFVGCIDRCDKFIMLRTRKSVFDIYSVLNSYHKWAVFSQPLVKTWPAESSYDLKIGEDGNYEFEILDEEEYNKGEMYYDCHGEKTMAWCVENYKSRPLWFECEMQCNPVLQEGNVFKWSDIHLFKPTDAANSEDRALRGAMSANTHLARTILYLDLATGVSDDSDMSCIIAVRYYLKKYFVLDAWVGRWTFDQREAAMREAITKYPEAEFYCEADVGQMNHVRKNFSNLGIRAKPFYSKGKHIVNQVNYGALYEGKKAEKKGKIHVSLEATIASGNMYINSQMDNLKALQLQIIGFPEITLFDMIDAMACAVLVLTRSGNSRGWVSSSG